jgi:hypothetical protein
MKYTSIVVVITNRNEWVIVLCPYSFEIHREMGNIILPNIDFGWSMSDNKLPIKQTTKYSTFEKIFTSEKLHKVAVIAMPPAM